MEACSSRLHSVRPCRLLISLCIPSLLHESQMLNSENPPRESLDLGWFGGPLSHRLDTHCVMCNSFSNLTFIVGNSQIQGLNPGLTPKACLFCGIAEQPEALLYWLLLQVLRLEWRVQLFLDFQTASPSLSVCWGESKPLKSPP